MEELDAVILKVISLIFIFDSNKYQKVLFLTMYQLNNDSDNCCHDSNYLP